MNRPIEITLKSLERLLSCQQCVNFFEGRRDMLKYLAAWDLDDLTNDINWFGWVEKINKCRRQLLTIKMGLF